MNTNTDTADQGGANTSDAGSTTPASEAAATAVPVARSRKHQGETKSEIVLNRQRAVGSRVARAWTDHPVVLIARTRPGRLPYGAGEDTERVADKLIEGAQDFEEVSGPNYWLAKLYRALAANDDFCDRGFEAVRVQPRPH